MEDYRKYIFPGVLTLVGIILLISAFSTEQNSMFVIGCLALVVSGGVGLFAAMKHLSDQLRLILSVVLILMAGGLAYADYMSIKIPIDFNNEKERRYEHVKQRLIDIRTAQIAFKTKYNRYAKSPDTLVNFVKYDSLVFIKAEGIVPDTMTLDEAIKAGIASRDTSFVSVRDSLYNENPENRIHPFNPDSMVVVPFSGGAVFKMQAGRVRRSNVNVPVFQVTDSKPFDKTDILKVGSMNDPKTNGNWE